MLEIDLPTQKEALRRVLATRGVLGGLALLNDRTTYRYTGIYRLRAGAMRSVQIFDRDAEHRTWPRVMPLSAAFCRRLVQQVEVVTSHAGAEWRSAQASHGSLVQSCYGRLLADEGGRPRGSFLHFDVERRTIAACEISFLHEAVPQFLRYLD